MLVCKKTIAWIITDGQKIYKAIYGYETAKKNFLSIKSKGGVHRFCSLLETTDIRNDISNFDNAFDDYVKSINRAATSTRFEPIYIHDIARAYEKLRAKARILGYKLYSLEEKHSRFYSPELRRMQKILDRINASMPARYQLIVRRIA